MKNKLRILISLLFFFFATQSLSNTIEKINFIGLNNTSEDLLLQIIPVKEGQGFNDALSNEIIESLFSTGLFSDISIKKNVSTLDIVVTENPTIKFFEFGLVKEKGLSSWLKSQEMLFTF